jgi:stalled ribosome rescue protein Dom34
LVQVDRAHARIGLLHDGVVDAIVRLDADPVSDVGPHMSAGPAPGFHRGTHGRAGADEAQRQRREASERLLATAVRRVTALAEDALAVVVGGATDTAKRFVQALPQPLAARSVIVDGLRMGSPDAMLPQILAALRELRHREQAAHLAELRDAAAARGRAALGFERARRAAEVGAIAELIFTDAAWRAHPAEIEALVHRALAAGASVEWTALEDGEASEVDGVIAGLRFTV